MSCILNFTLILFSDRPDRVRHSLGDGWTERRRRELRDLISLKKALYSKESITMLHTFT